MLRRIVRKVLAEAGGQQQQQPQDAAASAKTQRKSAKALNAIAPGAQVDPGVIVQRSAIGYLALSSEPEVPESEKSSRVVGDSALVDSYVYESVIESSAVASSKVVQAHLRRCDVSGAMIFAAASLTDCVVRESALGNITAVSSKFFDDSSVNSDYIFRPTKSLMIPVTMSQTTLRRGSRIKGQGKIAGCNLNNVQADLRAGAQLSVVNADDATISGNPIIRGAAGSPVEIGYARIFGSAQILSSEKGSPMVVGFEEQYATVEERAKITDAAHVSGTVSGDAQVFGKAKVHRGVRITGDCRVGGTAEMLSGTYTTGEYMSGKHTGGDPKSLTDRAMSAIKSAL